MPDNPWAEFTPIPLPRSRVFRSQAAVVRAARGETPREATVTVPPARPTPRTIRGPRRKQAPGGQLALFSDGCL